MWGALFMADSVRMDLRDLGAEAWVLWQPDWNVIAFDAEGGAPHLEKQFYALAQYTRFIRPGFQIISAGGAYNTLAAYSAASKRLVLVSTNWEKVTAKDLDLSAFRGLPSSVTLYRTTADEATQSATRRAFRFHRSPTSSTRCRRDPSRPTSSTASRYCKIPRPTASSYYIVSDATNLGLNVIRRMPAKVCRADCIGRVFERLRPSQPLRDAVPSRRSASARQ